MRTSLGLLIGPLLCLAPAFGFDDETPKKVQGQPAPIASIRKSAATPSPEFDEAREADALAFVERNHPELAKVLQTLKPMNPPEYRKAISELSQVARTLRDLEARNPRRHELVLDTWKAKSRVELLAAQLAGGPSEELRSQLRAAIEAKVDVEIRRQRFELDQAELAAKKAREALDRLENHRDTVVEARFRALQPKKPVVARKLAKPNPNKPADSPTRTP